MDIGVAMVTVMITMGITMATVTAQASEIRKYFGEITFVLLEPCELILINIINTEIDQVVFNGCMLG